MFQAVWSSFPLTFPLTFPAECALPRRRFVGRPGVRLVPYLHHRTVTERPVLTEENRMFFLDRAVFDFVNAHRYLSLTDPLLLSWYLHLSREDRKIIKEVGGFRRFLQRHPALHMSRHHVYVKYLFGSTGPGLQTFMPNNCSATGAEECKCGMTHSLLEMEMFPGGVMEEETGHAEGLQTGFPVTPEPNHQLLSANEEGPLWQVDGSGAAPVDVSVEPDGPREGDFYSPSQSAAEREFPSDYYSYADDRSFIQPAAQQQVGFRQDQMVYGDAAEGDQSKSPYSVMEDHNRILAFLGVDDVKAHGDGVPVDPKSEAAGGERPDQATKGTAEKFTSTEPPLSTSAFTQTEDPGVSDKHIITEVHMADLDYLAEEFIKLKGPKEKLREQKQTVKSSGCKLSPACDCEQRAQQAELSLLFLQFSMCRQHCWRLYYNCAEGPQLGLNLKNPPPRVQCVLQKLEFDYNQMREKVLAGIPLGQLRPLSVDSEKIIAGASYIPAQVGGNVPGDVPPWSSQKLQEPGASSEENGRASNQSKKGSENKKKEKQAKAENSKAKRAVTTAPKKQTGLHSGETWRSAEEDLQAARPAEKTDESAGEEAKSPALMDSDLPSDKCCKVSSQPAEGGAGFNNSLCQSDAMQWFERNQAPETSISEAQNNFSVAMVMRSGAESADAAASEPSGCTFMGRAAESAQETFEPREETKRELPLSSSVESRKAVCSSPTAKGTCVPEHYGTMGGLDALAELTWLRPDVGRQKIADALELRAERRRVLDGPPFSTTEEETSEPQKRRLNL